MGELRFTSDPRKAQANRRKHGVSFEEAEAVFLDEQALLTEDPDDSHGEDRFVILGLSGALRLLVVCHCERDQGETIRIISARRATKPEQATYWGRLTR